MGQVNADNPKPRAATPPPPAPADSSGSLEDRIDSLLSEMQESLDEIDRTADADTPPTRERTRKAEKAAAPTPQDEALAAALDEAVAQAENALHDDDTQPTETARAPAVLDPEMDFTPGEDVDVESEEPATEDGADDTPIADAPPQPINALDEKLARRAEALAEEPEPVVGNAKPIPESAPAPDIVERGGSAPKVAPMLKVPATATEPEPSAKASRPQPKPKGKAKIAVRKRTDGAEAGTGAPADGSSAAEEAGGAEAPAEASVASTVGAPAPAPATNHKSAPQILQTTARPLRFVPPHVRDYIGWFGLLTLFNAACVWIFWLLLRA